jgi:hypothetical protein
MQHCQIAGPAGQRFGSEDDTILKFVFGLPANTQCTDDVVDKTQDLGLTAIDHPLVLPCTEPMLWCGLYSESIYVRN